MRTIALIIVQAFLLCAGHAHADAVMRPVDPSYPGTLFRHTLTEVTVTLHGSIAETEVYCEFINEWDHATGGVFSFPLPMDANATQMSFGKSLVFYDAILKPVIQSNTPGTGAGGFAAELNAYLGKNAVNLKIDTIAAGAVQQIYLKYIQRLPYYNGSQHYAYPLASGVFQPNPLASLGITVRVFPGPALHTFASASHAAGWRALQAPGNVSEYRYEASKVYLERDLRFSIAMGHSTMQAELYSAAGRNGTGYFAFSLYPASACSRADVFNRNIAFVLDVSRSMAGYKLQQSCEAIKACIGQLDANDRFSIIAFSDLAQTVLGPLPANATSHAAASQALDSLALLKGPSATQLAPALASAISAVTGSGYAPIVVVCTDGFSPCTPDDIVNTANASIFTLGLGQDVSRARLEAIACRNNGFAAFIGENEPVAQSIIALFDAVKHPTINSFMLDFAGAIVRELLPDASPYTFFNGLGYFIAGKFGVPGAHNAAMGGHTVTGDLNDFFSLEFNGDTASADLRFVEQLWAAEKIKAWEREIEVYNRATQLRDSVIALSLVYNVKSQFTSFWADTAARPADSIYVEDEGTSVIVSVDSVPGAAPGAMALAVTPNPFNPDTWIRLTLPATAKAGVAAIAIYDLAGRLISIVKRNVSGNAALVVHWNGRTASGLQAASGVYVVICEYSGHKVHTRISLVR
ncbi:MAG: hypothetical protein A2268_07055 [Candidatus Raymondbacteria bacterium RifOxyA12_full_50_37]|uniref:VWFA domain-containing protein n=1 Tax=Candidatus Raymondbacteria bacterium RIFOXYD12_FULL_49_13 TaxID=1817890 RepID=A0A1F7FEB5_UNCRA|nr:MAG: hypothetical protein A2268_07055 [Candidatus Raymondbacteria bacterium RifOxyA12_full_50_37]OGJ91143.1 MAG: hypothetical protein A2248_01205 [Candidatus Raymondbacteria bacterium RIFOXYA2_FULL_49_16]OGJ95189.1 MAG: hypothetical protein A2487_12415 [Candidatus Raymondbacteria bacterium RifOxyC12_full_50_8]OGJ97541.1 MAG: hypothetical protein A2453_01970 [Candidatus Raymondbacteria bacterium RIFOXYC2_FULL_50_21]OGK05015.1 MAG: hypothetical protein A2519_10080 [Candidatus Raymondbacteria b